MFALLGQLEVAGVQFIVTAQVAVLLLLALVAPVKTGFKLQVPVATPLAGPLRRSDWHLPLASVAAITR
jgi:hypothetical protein